MISEISQSLYPTGGISCSVGAHTIVHSQSDSCLTSNNAFSISVTEYGVNHVISRITASMSRCLRVYAFPSLYEAVISPAVNASRFTALAAVDLARNLTYSVRRWFGRIAAQTLFIEPGSPWKKGYNESFNGKLRDELLHREIFYTLREAKVIIE